MNPFFLIKNFRIRYKLLFIYSATFFLIISLSGLILYSIVRQNVEENMEKELQNSTHAILNTVKTAVSVSIKNHLRATAEKNHDIVTYLHRLETSGQMTRSEAQKQAADILLCQKIGTDGYLCILDGNGKVLKHPKKTLEGLDISDYQFVQEMIRKKNGYIEYEWKNPGDSRPRDKALYIRYFEPWDWLITVSSYRREFSKLVDIDDFKESIINLTFGKTGYSFVLDTSGTVIIHPEIAGMNVLESPDPALAFLKTMIRQKNGKMIYSWKTAREDRPGKKLVIFNHLPEYEWIVASSSRMDEFFSPLVAIKKVMILVGLISFLVFIPITFVLSSTITNPLQALMKRFDQEIAGSFSDRMTDTGSRDEIGQLTVYYNSFMDRLDTYDKDLQAQIAGRRQAQDALMEIKEKERQKIGNDLHDDLCPHLIGIEGLSKVLKRKVEEGHSEQAAILSDKITALIRDAIYKTRLLARGLCPVYFNHGLESALRELVTQTRVRHGVDCRLTISGDLCFENSMVTVNLYYIAQESVHNALRHGRADTIDIQIKQAADQLFLTITDNGVGMPAAPGNPGMGLHIMNYRAGMIGATLEIRSDDGTCISLAMPRPDLSGPV